MLAEQPNLLDDHRTFPADLARTLEWTAMTYSLRAASDARLAALIVRDAYQLVTRVRWPDLPALAFPVEILGDGDSAMAGEWERWWTSLGRTDAVDEDKALRSYPQVRDAFERHAETIEVWCRYARTTVREAMDIERKSQEKLDPLSSLRNYGMARDPRHLDIAVVPVQGEELSWHSSVTAFAPTGLLMTEALRRLGDTE
jgi:1,2-phenylacetyl-CoA epoxidase PaaB subunit